MNDLEKYYIPFGRDMVCLAATARHVMCNKTTCKDFRKKGNLDQDKARSVRDFFICWDRESKGISMHLGQFVDPAVCSWAEAGGLTDRCGTQHLPLGCSSPFTTSNSHLGRGGRPGRWAALSPHLLLMDCCLHAKSALCSGTDTWHSTIAKMSFTCRCNGLHGWSPNGEM